MRNALIAYAVCQFIFSGLTLTVISHLLREPPAVTGTTSVTPAVAEPENTVPIVHCNQRVADLQHWQPGKPCPVVDLTREELK